MDFFVLTSFSACDNRETIQKTHIVFSHDHAMRIVVEDPTIKCPWFLTAEAADVRPLAHFCAVESIGSDPSDVAAVKTDELGNYGKVLHPKTAVQMDDRTKFASGPASTIRIPKPPPL